MYSVTFNLSTESSKCFDVSITGDDLPDGSDSLEVALSLDSNRTQYGIGVKNNVTRIFIGSVDAAFTEGINITSVLADSGVLLSMETTDCLLELRC